MTEVYDINGATLSYCDAEEYYELRAGNKEFSALLCAKNPFHKEIVGYLRNCPKDDPEYLVAHRRERHIMALNMIDAPKPEFFSDDMIMAGLDFIQSELADGRDVVVVCNQGESRSPTMCLMYLMVHGDFGKELDVPAVFEVFSRLAPNWNPNQGILRYCISLWNRIREGELKID